MYVSKRVSLRERWSTNFITYSFAARRQMVKHNWAKRTCNPANPDPD